jgi:Enolase C-terminal domain-like
MKMKITGCRTAVVRVGQAESINGVHIVLRLQTDNGLEGISYITRLHEAEIYGSKVVPHLATEILSHLIAAVPNGLTVEYYPWAMPLFQEVPPVENGELVLSDRPGLGLDFDEAALRRYAHDA